MSINIRCLTTWTQAIKRFNPNHVSQQVMYDPSLDQLVPISFRVEMIDKEGNLLILKGDVVDEAPQCVYFEYIKEQWDNTSTSGVLLDHYSQLDDYINSGAIFKLASKR